MHSITLHWTSSIAQCWILPCEEILFIGITAIIMIVIVIITIVGNHNHCWQSSSMFAIVIRWCHWSVPCSRVQFEPQCSEVLNKCIIINAAINIIIICVISIKRSRWPTTKTAITNSQILTPTCWVLRKTTQLETKSPQLGPAFLSSETREHLVGLIPIAHNSFLWQFC